MSNEVKHALDFMRVHDGSQSELSEREKSIAAELFKNLCLDLILANLDKAYQLETGAAYTETCVDFIFTSSDGSYLDITVTQKTESDLGIVSSFFVLVTEYNSNKNQCSDYFYSMDREDLQVERHDSGRDEDIPDEIEYDEFTTPFHTSDELMLNEICNMCFEQEMGMNDQPVGIDEINQLRLIIELSDLTIEK